MFKFILRWTMNLIAIVFIGFVGFFTVEAYQKTSKEVAIEKKIVKEKAEKAKIEADRIYNLPENVEKRAKAKAISVAELTASQDCRTRIKSMALIPSSVDFYDFIGTSSRTYENFSPEKHRIIIRRDGDMKNAFGTEIKFKGVCKYDYFHKTNTISLVEVLI